MALRYGGISFLFLTCSALASTAPTSSSITPPTGFSAHSTIGYALYGEFLYWIATETNLDAASSGVDPSSQAPKGTTLYPGFRYEPGFKVGMAFDIGHDHWYIDANYTWFHGKGSTQQLQSGDSEIINSNPIISILNPTDSITEASTSWWIHHNFLTANIGRHYKLSPSFTARPFVGLAGAWNRQENPVHYTVLDSSPLPGSVNQAIDLTNSQSYYGVGLTAGVMPSWKLHKNWSIYGLVGIMNLWSQYQVSRLETVTTISDETGEVLPETAENTIDTLSHAYGIQPVSILRFGVLYSTRIGDDTVGMTFQLGYEEQIWVNHIHFEDTGTLSFQGLNARLRFEF
jgi:hypothetical protein